MCVGLAGLAYFLGTRQPPMLITTRCRVVAFFVLACGFLLESDWLIVAAGAFIALSYLLGMREAASRARSHSTDDEG
jgi:hypothetical protein